MLTQVDSLQDICIFYCVNHLDTLAKLLEYFKNSCDDASSSFSMLLGNRILEYYFKCHLEEDSEEPYLDAILATPNICNSLLVNRKCMLTTENVSNLAQNTIKVLEFTIFDHYKFIKEEFEELVHNNLKNITRLKIKQKSTACDIEGLLQLLSGGETIESKRKHGAEQDKNTNHSKGKKVKKCLRYLSKLGKFDKKDKMKESGILSSPSTEQGATSQMKNESPDDQSTSDLISDSDMAESPCDTGSDIDLSVNKHTIPLSDRYIPNLVSFHYNMCYSSLENLTNAYAVFDRLCCIIEKNTQLQSITIVSVMPNPCKWFLLNTDMVYKLENLHSLVLSHATKKNMDIDMGSVLFSKLPALKKLRHLDLSYGFEDNTTSSLMKYSKSEVDMFREALKQMVNLKSIDVSGSNLCNVIGHADGLSDSDCKDHCMPGFEGRMFDYIGLFNCESCSHKSIPALRVSGNTDEGQLLVAIWSYHHNQMIMSRVLTELRFIVGVEDSSVKQGLAFIEGLLVYLEELGDWHAKYTEAKHLELKNIHLTLINLFYLLKLRDVKANMSTKTRRVLVERMMVILKNALDDVNLAITGYADPHVIVRICMMVFMIIRAENVVVYCHKYDSYLKMLVNVLHSRSKHNAKMLALTCVHSAVRYSQEYKERAGGHLGLVKTLLEDLSSSVTYNPSNEQMERESKMWSILWTLTDDVPSNCGKFVSCNGCSVAQHMIKAQTENADFLRKLTGALSNVSENLDLHPHLMEENLVSLMRSLLLPVDGDYYDISSHAAAFLVLLAAAGPDYWTLDSPTHDEILEDVDSVIKKWDINESKGVKFRTLVPMLTQIANVKCAVAQFWGGWMICNLMIVKPEGYCDMLITEGGLDIIDSVLREPTVREDVKEILTKILQLAKNFKEGTYDSDNE